MDNLIKNGRNMFAAGMIALGILCIVAKDFIVGRPPAWPMAFTINPLFGYVSGVVMALCGVTIILRKKAGFAAMLIAVLILLLSVLRHLPSFMNDWLNGYKSMALFGGAIIVAISFYKEEIDPFPKFMDNEALRKILILTACILLAAFFIAAGYAHFKFAGFVKDFIPAYIPFHVFWTYFCGICLIAGGAGLIIPSTRKPAALLSGIMVLGWFLLLHIPRFIADTSNASDRMGLCESFAFSGIFFVLAGISSKK